MAGASMTAGVTVLVGLVLLGVASDAFVVASARLATLLRIPAVVVGAVVIGFGTSAPELLVSLLASLEGEASLAVGNVIGSNLANLTLVLGAAAVAGTVVVGSRTVRRELPVSTAAVCLFAGCAAIGLGAVTGVVLAVALGAAIVIVVRSARTGSGAADLELAEEVAELEAGEVAGRLPTLLRAGAGLVGTLVGAQLVIVGAVQAADRLGISEGFVGLTVVAVGTSLPELVTAVQGVRRGESELIVGNVLGSNLFNSLAAGAVIAAASGGFTAEGRLLWSLALMVVTAVVAAGLLATRHRLGRAEGAALLLGYTATVPLLAGS